MPADKVRTMVDAMERDEYLNVHWVETIDEA